MQGDRCASCENIVSRSQTSSLPPPRPVWVYTCLAVVAHSIRVSVILTQSETIHRYFVNYSYVESVDVTTTVDSQ